MLLRGLEEDLGERRRLGANDAVRAGLQDLSVDLDEERLGERRTARSETRSPFFTPTEYCTSTFASFS